MPWLTSGYATSSSIASALWCAVPWQACAYLNMPVSAFAGVAIRVVTREGEIGPIVTVVLEHKDPSLALPLISGETAEAFAE